MLKKVEIKNLKDLWRKLSDNYNGLESGTVTLKEAAELNNTAGKMIAIAKAQIEHEVLVSLKGMAQIQLLELKETK